MRAEGLVDTGALLALLDRNHRWHEPCVEAFAELPLPLATSAAVLAELFHLIGDADHDRDAAWELLRSGAFVVLPIDDADMPEAERLMAKYADRPMEFADATLVVLAAREELTTIFTIDHDDFETYRIGGRRRFRISPSRPRGA